MVSTQKTLSHVDLKRSEERLGFNPESRWPAREFLAQLN